MIPVHSKDPCTLKRSLYTQKISVHSKDLCTLKRSLYTQKSLELYVITPNYIHIHSKVHTYSRQSVHVCIYVRATLEWIRMYKEHRAIWSEYILQYVILQHLSHVHVQTYMYKHIWSEYILQYIILWIFITCTCTNIHVQTYLEWIHITIHDIVNTY